MTTDNQIPENEVTQALFAELVMMLTTSAMQHLGRMPNRATGKAAVNLDAAGAYIDMLDVLERKTRGNLDRDEEQMMRETLSMLKLAFVDAQHAAAAGAGAPAAAPAPAEAPPPPPPPSAPPRMAEEAAASGAPAVEGEPASREHKEPRFHKKYG